MTDWKPSDWDNAETYTVPWYFFDWLASDLNLKYPEFLAHQKETDPEWFAEFRSAVIAGGREDMRELLDALDDCD